MLGRFEEVKIRNKIPIGEPAEGSLPSRSSKKKIRFLNSTASPGGEVERSVRGHTSRTFR